MYRNKQLEGKTLWKVFVFVVHIQATVIFQDEDDAEILRSMESFDFKGDTITVVTDVCKKIQDFLIHSSRDAENVHVWKERHKCQLPSEEKLNLFLKRCINSSVFTGLCFHTSWFHFC